MVKRTPNPELLESLLRDIAEEAAPWLDFQYSSKSKPKDIKP